MDTVTSLNSAAIVDIEMIGQFPDWVFDQWSNNAVMVLLVDYGFEHQFNELPESTLDRFDVVIRNTHPDKSKVEFYKTAVTTLKGTSNLTPVVAMVPPQLSLQQALFDCGLLAVLGG